MSNNEDDIVDMENVMDRLYLKIWNQYTAITNIEELFEREQQLS